MHHAGARGDARRRKNVDRGASLIEIVVAISLMGVIMLPLMAAVRTSIKASATNEAAAIAETAIVDAADRINRAPMACDYAVYVRAAVQIRGWDPGLATISHEYWDIDTDSWQPGGCELSGPTDRLVQRLEVSITAPHSAVTRSIEVLKSNV